MNTSDRAVAAQGQPEKIRKYYSRHAGWYDSTRWTFLFGRDEALKYVRLDPFSEETLLEVGCGTGRNLKYMAQHFIQIFLIGVDVSPEMLNQADKNLERYEERISLYQQPYAPGTFELPQKVERILCSYSLSMFNPGWEQALDRAAQDLAPEGKIIVVDFHRSKFRWFRWWMGKNHVRMDGHLLEALQARFTEKKLLVHSAWFGLWEYFIFVGENK